MEGFDAFASLQTTDADPVAEFLVREQSELAGLKDVGISEPVQNPDQDTSFGLLGEPAATTPVLGFDQVENVGIADFSQEQTDRPADAYSAISEQDIVRAEPEKLRLWREQHVKRLEQKDAVEEKEKDEWRQKAKKELDDWYKHHNDQLQKTQEANRETEAALIRDRNEKVPAKVWEKVAGLCEFNPKNSKNTKDVSRMRSILLQLKQMPLVR